MNIAHLLSFHSNRSRTEDLRGSDGVRPPLPSAWHPRRLPAQSRITAFTLVELLVCIAIIGILAALTFSISGMVRDSAIKARCSSNLRQCGTGISLYAAEHRGMAPGIRWTLEIQPYISAFAVTQSSGYDNAKGKFPISCPGLAYDDSEYGRSTYSMNSWLDTDHSNQNTDPSGKISYSWKMPLRNVEAPARKIMLFDAIMSGSGATEWAFNAVKGVEYIDFRHGAAANILFVDGHVSALKAGQIHDGMWDWQGGGGAE